MTKRTRKPKLKTKPKPGGHVNGAQDTADKARALLKAADEKRVAECAAAVAEVLKQFNCRMTGVPAFSPAGQGTFTIGIQIKIETNEEEPSG